VHFCLKNYWNVRFFGGLAIFCCIVRSFLGMWLKKSRCAFLLSVGFDKLLFQLPLVVTLFTEQKHLVRNYNVLLCLQALWEGL
jgi:hypothetical protein